MKRLQQLFAQFKNGQTLSLVLDAALGRLAKGNVLPHRFLLPRVGRPRRHTNVFQFLRQVPEHAAEAKTTFGNARKLMLCSVKRRLEKYIQREKILTRRINVQDVMSRLK
jgi:hypothetical protein